MVYLTNPDLEFLIVSGATRITEDITRAETEKNYASKSQYKGRMLRIVKHQDIKIHPEFNEKLTLNDIAMISVANVLPFDLLKENIRIAPKLELAEQMPKGGDVCQIAGWGQIRPRLTKDHYITDWFETKRLGDPHLQVANVTIWSGEKCVKNHAPDKLPDYLKAILGESRINGNQICAGHPGGDMCSVSTP